MPPLDATAAPEDDASDPQALRQALDFAVEMGSATAGTVRAVVLYSPFDLSDRQVVDVAWRPGLTLAEALGELPDGINWTVVSAGREWAADEWAGVALEDGQAVVLSANPEKGGFGRILAMVALIVVVAAATYFSAGALGPAGAGLLSAAGAAAAGAVVGGVVSLAGGMLINSLMPPPGPKTPGGKETNDSPSYGLDGPKPTSREETAVPVTYGRFRQAGNRINYYSENSGDGKTQILYVQMAVSEGEIEDITDLVINDQPVGNYRDITWEKRLGTLTQAPLPWFAATVVPYAVGSTIGTADTVYTTVGDVDRIRLDVEFPQGLFSLDKKKGDRRNRDCSFEASATPIGGGPSYPFTFGEWAPCVGGNGAGGGGVINTAGGQPAAVGTRLRITVRAHGADGANAGTAFSGLFRVRSATDNSVLLEQTYSGTVSNTYVADGSWRAGTADAVFEAAAGTATAFVLELPAGFGLAAAEVYAGATLLVSRNERSPFRLSFESAALPRGRYTVRIKRHRPESTTEYEVDRATLGAVNEVSTDPVAYRRTAYYAIRARLNDQFSQEPVPSVLVKGRKVTIYDKNGVAADYRWSDNPADVALDILLSPSWGSRLKPSRIDFAAFSRWRDFCAANALTFNATFDYLTNVWDALLVVCRVGRASPLVSGLRWTVAIEGPSEPVMMFGTQNIIKGSFKSSWSGRQGRANHIEVQYYDKADGQRRNSVFAVDEAALARGEPLRQSTLNLVGVDNAAQAQKEAELQRNLNVGIQHGVRFEAHLEAMGCQVGDVVLVQHDMPKWGWADRVKAASGDGAAAGTVITLENALTPAGNGTEPAAPTELMPAGDWRVLLLKGAVLRGTNTVTAVSGRQVTVAGAIWNKTRRVVIAGVDYRVEDHTPIGGNAVLVLDRAPGAVAGQAAQMWEVDALIETTIQRPYVWGRSITLSAAALGAPIQAGDQVFIGRVDKFKKPFRIVKLARDGEHTFSLDCVEYNESLYSASGFVPPGNYSEIPAAPLHVGNLRVDQVTQDVGGGGVRYLARALWDLPLNDLRGHAGSKVQVAVNNGPFQLNETAVGGKAESYWEGSVGDVVRFRVVAFDRDGFDANIASAPVGAVTLGRRSRAPDAPSGLTAAPGIKLIALRWTLPADPDVKAVEVWENTSNNRATAYQLDQGLKSFFTRSGLATSETRFYWIRAVSFAGEPSAWVGPVSATTSYLLTDDIGQAVINNAHFASTIQPVELIENLSAVAPDNTTAVNKADGKLYVRTLGAWKPMVEALGPNATLTSEQIDSLQAIKIAGQLGPTQIADGAIDAAKLAVGSNANLVTNPCCFASTAGWTNGSATGTGGINFTTFLPGFQVAATMGIPTYGSGYATVAAIVANSWADIGWRPGTPSRLPVEPGKRYEWQCRVLPGQCRITPFLVWYDAAGAQLGSNNGGTTGAAVSGAIATNAATWTAADALAAYTRVHVIATAPANAATCVPMLRMSGTGGTTTAATNPRVAWTQALFGQAHPNQMTPSNWAAGGITFIDGSMVRTGTLAADRIVAGSITTAQIAAGSITAEKLAVGPGSGNRIFNSCLAHSNFGWAAGGASPPSHGGRVGWGDPGDPGTAWRLAGIGTGYAARLNPGSNTIPAGSWMDYWWQPEGHRVAVDGSTWWEFSARVQLHRCSARMIIQWFDGNGVSVGENMVAQSEAFASGGGTQLNEYKLLWGKAQAPAGATRAVALFRVLGNGDGGLASGASPYLMFTQAQLCPSSSAPAAGSQPAPFAPGGVTEIMGGLIRTNTIVADHITAGAITTDKLVANAITAGKIGAGAIRAEHILGDQIRAEHLLTSDALIVNTAQIGNLIVGTTKITDNAVTDISIAQQYNYHPGISRPGGYGYNVVGLASLTVAVPAGVSGRLLVTANPNAGNSFGYTVALVGGVLQQDSGGGGSGGGDGGGGGGGE